MEKTGHVLYVQYSSSSSSRISLRYKRQLVECSGAPTIATYVFLAFSWSLLKLTSKLHHLLYYYIGLHSLRMPDVRV